MEDSVDFMHRQGVQDLVWLRDVSMNKSKIRLRIQYASVVERGTIVNFVEGEYIVFGICERQVPDDQSAAFGHHINLHVAMEKYIHETCTTSYKDVPSLAGRS